MHFISEITVVVSTLFLKLGYGGIIFLMALESSFIPFPSEIVMPPAGYFASQGKMNFWVAILCGVIGSLIGSFVNYFIAEKLGRRFILKYGKFMGMDRHRFRKMEKYFKEHGAISTFVGRLLPGIRQYISFPAGVIKMNKWVFALFTALGAFIWVFILTYIGYLVGDNKELIHKYIKELTPIIVIAVVILIVLYVLIHKKRKKGHHGKKN